MSETIKLFVYGTLKKDFPAYRYMDILNEDKVVATSISGYEMYDVRGSYPAVLVGDGVIHGEIHEYPASILKSLDEYEGCPYLYTREKIKINGEYVFIYIFTDEGRCKRYYRRIEKGVWER